MTVPVQIAFGSLVVLGAYLIAILSIPNNFKLLLIGSFLVALNAVQAIILLREGRSSRTAFIYNFGLIAAFSSFLLVNYALDLGAKLIHLFSLWIVLFFATHVLYARVE
jgi:hypothetical protein